MIFRIMPGMWLVSLIGCSIPTGFNIAQPVNPSSQSPQAAIDSTQYILASATKQTNEVSPRTPEPIEPTPIKLTIDPTYLNFATNTPTPTIDPGQILLKIITPGPMSKVVSPIDFVVHIAPGYAGTTRIELIGEDGIELYRKVFKTYSNIGYFTKASEKINFEISGAAEIARLQISTFDNFGRMQAFSSVRLLLQSVGENEFNPMDALRDNILVRYPLENDEFKGNSLPVTGEFLPVTDQPLVLELIDESSTVIGSRVLQFSIKDGNYQNFNTSIPFQIKQKTPVRLVLRQSDDRIKGLAYLFSRVLILIPE